MADRIDEDDGEQQGERKGGKSSSKSKDLSHVPCKFFRLGSCTAGASCPFSHATTQDTGGQKDTCTWFVKGNCKFGHKCALAHILPGQTMAMDRKNKKAAQLAAGGGGKDKPARGGRRENNGPRNPLLAGMTAPTRPLKATPAPPLRDMDVEPKVEKPLEKPAPRPYAAAVLKGTPAPPPKQAPVTPAEQDALPLSTPRRSHQSMSSNPDFGPIGSPPRANGFSPGTSPQSNSPFSAPGTQSIFVGGRQVQQEDDAPQDSKDFRARAGMAASLGTLGMTKKWPAPEESSVLNETVAEAQRKEAERKESFNMNFAVEDDEGDDLANSRDDLEEFIPGSLTDLLTPEERSRRMSRSISGGARPVVQGSGSTAIQQQSSARIGILRDRSSESQPPKAYPQSVPAPSLLGGDLRNIWADPESSRSPPMGTSPIGTPRGGFVGGGDGTPGSFKSSHHFGGRSFADGTGRSFGDSGRAFMEDGGMGRSFGDRSAPMLSPSNASGAFLSNVHARRATAAHNNTPLFPQTPSALNGGANSPGLTSVLVGSPSRGNGFGGLDYRGNGPNIGFGVGKHIEESTSLTSRALQSHAPGQSLPQGLAAGYSRIHSQPMPANVPSPAAFSPGGTSAFSPVRSPAFGNAAFGSNAYPGGEAFSPGRGGNAFSPNQGNGFNNGGNYPSQQHQQQSWQAPQHPPHDYTQSQWNNSAHEQPHHQQQQQPSNQDLDAMFSRLSRPSGPPGLPGLPNAPSTGGPPGLPALQSHNSNGGAGSDAGPPGLGPRTNSGRAWTNQGSLSPLAGEPAVSTGGGGDDDDLFSMDG